MTIGVRIKLQFVNIGKLKLKEDSFSLAAVYLSRGELHKGSLWA